MSDETTYVTTHIELMKGEIRNHHNEINKLKAFKIGIVGEHGDNGWKIATNERIQRIEARQEALSEEQNNMKVISAGERVKLTAIVGLVSLVGAAVGAALIQLLLVGAR